MEELLIWSLAICLAASMIGNIKLKEDLRQTLKDLQVCAAK